MNEWCKDIRQQLTDLSFGRLGSLIRNNKKTIRIFLTESSNIKRDLFDFYFLENAMEETFHYGFYFQLFDNFNEHKMRSISRQNFTSSTRKSLDLQLCFVQIDSSFSKFPFYLFII